MGDNQIRSDSNMEVGSRTSELENGGRMKEQRAGDKRQELELVVGGRRQRK
jgi:hypothetical protein